MGARAPKSKGVVKGSGMTPKPKIGSGAKTKNPQSANKGPKNRGGTSTFR